MPIIKYFFLPKTNKKYMLPKHILLHCNEYKNIQQRQMSLYAWYKMSKYIDLNMVKINKNGKPIVIGNKQYISLSHSKNIVAIAIHSKHIGIDVQYLMPLSQIKTLAPKIFTNEELKQWQKQQNKVLAFTKKWTQYESFFKLCGKKIPKNEIKNIHFKTQIIKHKYVLQCLYK